MRYEHIVINFKGNVWDSEVQDLLPYGFAVHHAGLPRADRKLVEEPGVFEAGRAVKNWWANRVLPSGKGVGVWMCLGLVRGSTHSSLSLYCNIGLGSATQSGPVFTVFAIHHFYEYGSVHVSGRCQLASSHCHHQGHPGGQGFGLVLTSCLECGASFFFLSISLPPHFWMSCFVESQVYNPQKGAWDELSPMDMSLARNPKVCLGRRVWVKTSLVPGDERNHRTVLTVGSIGKANTLGCSLGCGCCG